ncbi:MAG: ABC transporter ATP-binding protein, partial [Candidatus Dadabacteria bacterium]
MKQTYLLPQVSIAANDLEVAYDGSLALSINSLQVGGNTIGLIGHNGAGKTTFMKTLLNLLEPYKGRLYARELQSNKVLFPKYDMAFCPESGSVFADISVESYIKLWCRVKKGDPDFYLKEEGKEIIDLFKASELLPKLGRELSKGQRRLIQTVIAFLITPQLILIDEPFDGLDIQKTSELVELLTLKKPKTTYIISTHHMDVIEQLCDKLIVLRKGKVYTSGNVEYVIKQLAP